MTDQERTTLQYAPGLLDRLDREIDAIVNLYVDGGYRATRAKHDLRCFVAAVRAEEREACAKVAEDVEAVNLLTAHAHEAVETGKAFIAAAIRARGTT